MEMTNDTPDRVIRINESYIQESNNELSFKYDKDLSNWMKSNISYSNFTKLKSHDEVLKSKKGSCHDQVMFEYEELKKLGYSPKGLFIIENDNKGQGGTTHSLVYYKKGDKLCWFENAWKGQEGITEYMSLKDIKDTIKDMYEDHKFGDIEKYGNLEFNTFSISAHKPGESLQQFVDICFGDSINEACTGIFDKIEDNPEIVETYGFKSSNNIYNVNVKIKGFDKWLRGRSELLIIKDNKIYLKKDSKKGYSIPGGGWDENEDHNLSAIRETNEEAKIKVKNVNYVSSYVAYFPPKDWVKERISEENWWYGEYIELYIGEYDGEFKGKIEDVDKSDYMASGKFYDIKSVYKDLIPQHQKAIDNIMHETVVLESYIEEIKEGGEYIMDKDKVHEAMNALMTGYIPGSVDNPNNVYIVNYMQNNVFSGEDPNEDCIGVADNPKFTNLIIRSNGVLKKVDESFLQDKSYKVYILEMSREEVSNRLNKYMNQEVEKGFIYETLIGKKLYTNDQVQFESKLTPTLDYYEYMETFKEICDNYFQAKDIISTYEKATGNISENNEIVVTDEGTFIPKEIKMFNNSGLMYSNKVYSLDEYINSKPNKVLECLDISIKEGNNE